jgi:hypothetical protein
MREQFCAYTLWLRTTFSHCGDRFLRRPGFPTVGPYTHFELRHLDGACFSHHDLHLTRPNGEVKRNVRTPLGRIVKCWISKIYLTRPSTEPSTFSRPM